jgi:CO dehydrogenase maturation factor
MRLVIDRLSDRYPFVVMDNEAGLEHLSRRTTRDVAHLLLITDPSQRGVVAARRAADLVTELNIAVGQTHLIINRLPGGFLPPALESAAQTVGAPLLGVIPADSVLQEFEFSGRPLVELGDDSPVVGAVARMMQQILK